MSNIDFQRYREDGDLKWNWGVVGDDTIGMNDFNSLGDSVKNYFQNEGHTVTLAIGEGFPAGYGPLTRISDDLYRIVKE